MVHNVQSCLGQQLWGRSWQLGAVGAAALSPERWPTFALPPCSSGCPLPGALEGFAVWVPQWVWRTKYSLFSSHNLFPPSFLPFLPCLISLHCVEVYANYMGLSTTKGLSHSYISFIRVRCLSWTLCSVSQYFSFFIIIVSSHSNLSAANGHLQNICDMEEHLWCELSVWKKFTHFLLYVWFHFSHVKVMVRQLDCPAPWGLLLSHHNFILMFHVNLEEAGTFLNCSFPQE